MKVIALPDTIDTLTFEASPPRSEGLHLSTVIKSLCVDLDPKRFAQSGDLPWKKFNTGFAFERVLEHAFQARRTGIFRPDEVVKDGIAMSPDGIDPDGWWLEEFKSTWMSDFDCPEHEKFRHWIWQIKAYALALDMNKARLRVLFINGDYRGGYEPSYKVWELHFTDEELQENWRMLLHHAKQKGML